MSQSLPEYLVHEMQDGLIEALRTAAVDAPAWHLTSADRWQLLRNTLLGHVRVRGKLRPRDLPLDTSCQAVIDSAARLLNLPPYTFSNGNIRFRHWLGMFLLLPVAKAGAREETPPSADDLLCATILEICFTLRGGVTQDVVSQAASPFVQRLIGVLGLSQQEWDRLVRKYQAAVRQRTPTHDAVLARWAARVIALPAEVRPEDIKNREEFRAALARRMTEFEGQRPSIEKMLADLDDLACCYVTLKAEKPQRYINRGTRHWLLRGASGWCSQSLALARDLMCGFEGALLFSDSDAVVGMWFPRTVSQRKLQKRLDERLTEFWQLQDGAGMAERFPRLWAWLGENLPEGTGLQRNTNLPALSVRCLAALSVLDICLYRVAEEEAGAKPSDDDTFADGTCARVLGDVAVEFQTSPPWLQDESDEQETIDGTDSSKEKNQKERFGITSMIWALSGTAFRTHAYEGLCTALNVPDLRLQAVKHGKWLRQLGLPNDSLVHLKIDGDGVGDRFRTSSLADFPSLSMQLARMVQRRLVAGVQAVLEKFPAEPLQTVPVDVVYVGGDDVYVILPWTVLDFFLSGFSDAVQGLEENPWQLTPFTFVAARLTPRDDLLAGIEEGRGGAGSQRSNRFAAANLAAARLVTEGLKHVKNEFKEETSLKTTTIQAIIKSALSQAKLGDHPMVANPDGKPQHYGSQLACGRHLIRGLVFEVGPRTQAE